MVETDIILLENGARQSYIYNCRSVKSRRSIEQFTSNGAIFNDFEQPLTQFSRSCHSLTLNISQTAKGSCYKNANREQNPSFRIVPFRMTLSDLAKYAMTRNIARPRCDI